MDPTFGSGGETSYAIGLEGLLQAECHGGIERESAAAGHIRTQCLHALRAGVSRDETQEKAVRQYRTGECTQTGPFPDHHGQSQNELPKPARARVVRLGVSRRTAD